MLSHNSLLDVHKSRKGAAVCDAPPDDQVPMKCSASDAGSLYRALQRVLGDVDLRLMSRRQFFGTSLFWKGNDPRVLRELRIDGVLARKLPKVGEGRRS